MNKQQKHPKGLIYLFLTEMWERFSFYGISGILVLYLSKALNVSDGNASLVSGAYMAFTFLAPILGGYVADKLIGYTWSVIIGGVVILLGNIIRSSFRLEWSLSWLSHRCCRHRISEVNSISSGRATL